MRMLFANIPLSWHMSSKIDVFDDNNISRIMEHNNRNIDLRNVVTIQTKYQEIDDYPIDRHVLQPPNDLPPKTTAKLQVREHILREIATLEMKMNTCYPRHVKQKLVRNVLDININQIRILDNSTNI